MKKYSFYGFIAGQILFVLVIEAIFFYTYLRIGIVEHLVLAGSTFIITSLSYFLSERMIAKDPHYFIQTVIGSTSVKLIFYVGIIAALLYFSNGNALAFVFFFFIIYLLVTSTEIFYLVRTLQSTQNKHG